jgi:hypothetical protein
MGYRLLKFLPRLAILGVFLICLPAALGAQEEEEEHSYRNEVALVLGGTYESDEKIGTRYSVIRTVALDFVDREERVSKAVVYAVKLVVEF